MKKILLFALLLFSLKSLLAQKQGQQLVDSLLNELSQAKEDTSKVNLLNNIGYELENMNKADSMLKYCSTSLTLAEKVNFKRGQGDALNLIGIAYDMKSDNEQALNNFKKSLKVREEIGDKKGMAATYNNMGIIYANLGNSPEAIKMYYAALKLNEETGNKAWMANNYNNLGIVFQGQSNYSEALKMSFAALKLYDTLGNKRYVATSYNNIGLLYWGQKEYGDALAIYAKALKIMEEEKDTPAMNHPYNNMAGIYAEMGNYPEALKNYFISLKIREGMGDKNLIADSYTGIALVYQKMKNYDAAIEKFIEAQKLYTETKNDYALAGIIASFGEIDLARKKFGNARNYFNEAMNIYRKISDPAGYYYIFEDLAKVDSADGNFKSALENYKQFILLRDSTVNQENNKKLVQAQMQYDFDKKEAATQAEQNKKDALTQAEIKKQRIIRNSVSGGLAIVILFSLIVYRQRNKISKEKKRSDELLLNILPAETAEELKTKGNSEARSFDEVTVMFTDFKNFTQASEKMNAKELVSEINYIFSEFDKIISKHNIEKIKTIGDSYMCAGGLPVANKTNAIDVVQAAIEIQEFIIQLKKEREKENKYSFEIRIGVHTGPVVAGIVGIKKFAYDIWGDTVNIASRMESSGEAGKVNISGATYELVKEKFSCAYRGKIQAKNKGEIDMYFVSPS